MKLINPDIFLEAAETMIAMPHVKYSCLAIEFANGFTSKEEIRDALTFYQDLFNVHGIETFLDNWLQCDSNYPVGDELTEVRLLALALAYEIAICKKQKKASRK